MSVMFSKPVENLQYSHGDVRPYRVVLQIVSDIVPIESLLLFKHIGQKVKEVNSRIRGAE